MAKTVANNTIGASAVLRLSLHSLRGGRPYSHTLHASRFLMAKPVQEAGSEDEILPPSSPHVGSSKSNPKVHVRTASAASTSYVTKRLSYTKCIVITPV